MRGRRATPKQRLVCGPCLAWVTRDERADLVVDTSPADDHVLTGPGAAEVDGAKLAEVRSQLCLLARGSYCCMFVVEVSGADNCNCHYAMNVDMVACKGKDMHTVWMRSKRAAPKERKVCQPCADWLVGEKLADIAPTAPRVESENVRDLIFVAARTFSELTGIIVFLFGVGATAHC